jgi:ParB family chromosome partitioning protein
MAKARKKQALGRGLSALLNDPDKDINSVEDKDADKVVGSIVELKLEHIEVNPFQPRTSFKDEQLEELASSIRELGVIQPITVRKVERNKYQLVSGERRFRSSKLAGLKSIPAYIRIANDQEALEMALVENIQRQDLDPIEISLSYQRLIDEINLTQEQMSTRVGKKRSTITNYLRLLKLDPIVQTGMRDGFISMGHGRALVNIENAEDQINIYQKVLKDKLSVRATEEFVRQYNKKDTGGAKPKLDNSAYKAKQKNISKFFGTKVNIKVNQKGNGRIIIPFASEEDLNRIHDLLNKND